MFETKDMTNYFDKLSSYLNDSYGIIPHNKEYRFGYLFDAEFTDQNKKIEFLIKFAENVRRL